MDPLRRRVLHLTGVADRDHSSGAEHDEREVHPHERSQRGRTSHGGRRHHERWRDRGRDRRRRNECRIRRWAGGAVERKRGITCLDERSHRREPIVGRLGERAGEQSIDRGRRLAAGRGERRNGRMHVLLGELDVLPRWKGWRARQHLECGDAERILIDALVDFLPPPLLGRHVDGRSHRRAGPRELHGVAGIDGLVALGNDFGEPEIEESHPRRLSWHALDEDIVGLEVAVDDPRLVGGAERTCELAQPLPRLGHRNSSA